MPEEEHYQPYVRLLNLGLFREMTEQEMRQQRAEHIACEYGVVPAKEFRPIREFMIRGILEAIQQAQTLPVSTQGLNVE